jgi:hypothetical protein
MSDPTNPQDWADDEDDLSFLTQYAVQTRYPGDDPTPEEAKRALEIAKAVRKYAKPLL